MIIKEYIKKNKVLISIAFLLSAMDTLSTIIGVEFGGNEKMAIANFFLQYGYMSFMIYMIIYRILFLIFIIYSEYLVLFLINNYVRKKSRKRKPFVIIEHLTTRTLIMVNSIWIIVVINNIYQLYIIFLRIS